MLGRRLDKWARNKFLLIRAVRMYAHFAATIQRESLEPQEIFSRLKLKISK